MRDKPERPTDAEDRTVKDIRCKTRKRFSSEDKIRIVLAGLRGEDTIVELCRQEGIAQNQHYSWSKGLSKPDASGWQATLPVRQTPERNCWGLRSRRARHATN